MLFNLGVVTNRNGEEVGAGRESGGGGGGGGGDDGDIPRLLTNFSSRCVSLGMGPDGEEIPDGKEGRAGFLSAIILFLHGVKGISRGSRDVSG